MLKPEQITVRILLITVRNALQWFGWLPRDGYVTLESAFTDMLYMPGDDSYASFLYTCRLLLPTYFYPSKGVMEKNNSEPVSKDVVKSLLSLCPSDCERERL